MGSRREVCVGSEQAVQCCECTVDLRERFNLECDLFPTALEIVNGLEHDRWNVDICKGRVESFPVRRFH